MDAKIDYISFTVMVDVRGAGEANAMEQAVIDALAEHHPAFFDACLNWDGWQLGGARGHYSTCLFHPTTYTAIRFGGSANHILVELPGTACQALKDEDRQALVVQEAAHRLTRLDIAVDIPEACSPREFVLSGYNERFKSYAEIVSAEGETEYVGSMKSERFARCYRYNAPHPRAGVLRVEHVMRSDYAKAAAAVLRESGVLGLAEACGNTFGWKSPFWQPVGITDGKLRARRADRHEPGRVRWLHHVCIPALVRADREGLIPLEDLVERLYALRAGITPPQMPPTDAREGDEASL